MALREQKKRGFVDVRKSDDGALGDDFDVEDDLIEELKAIVEEANGDEDRAIDLLAERSNRTP